MSSHLLAVQIRLALVAGAARAAATDHLGDVRRRRDSGEVTSQMILIAVFAALAIAVGGIIYTKVIATAEGVPTDVGPATGGA